MTTLQIDVPDELFLSFKDTPRELAQRIRMTAAVKLYELGKLSSGRAASLAGMSRISFLQSLAAYSVAIFDLTEAELQEDVANA